MVLAAQSVQSIGDLFLVRIYNRANEIENDTSNFLTNEDTEPDADDASIDTVASDEVLLWTKTAARMLQKQWPRQDKGKQHHSGVDDDEYYRKLIIHHQNSYPNYSLACSYLLMKCSGKTPSTKTYVCLGHGRLTECYESAGGNAAAATFILVDSDHRGNGYGSILVRLLEQEAKAKERLGCQYHFVYLWCKTATAPFYERGGYLPCRNRVSLQRPCLKTLTATSVQSLEDILRHRRADSAITTTVKKKLETVVLLPSSRPPSQSTNNNGSIIEGRDQDNAEEDVWLRKRLVDHVASIRISEKDRRNEINQFVAATSTAGTVSNEVSTNTIVVEKDNLKYRYHYIWNPNVPWQMQIGPTCGLTAIRMIVEAYFPINTKQREEYQEGLIFESSSILEDARNLGYTEDGEMFDTNNLRDLMRDQLLKAARSSPCDDFIVQTREVSSLTLDDIKATLQSRGLWILPYDSNPRTKLPGNFLGNHSHWGIVVGILYQSARTTATQSTTSANTSVSMAVDNSTLDAKVNRVKDNKGFSTSNPSKSEAHLIVQHSLSSKWAIAPMQEWIDSNRQLITVNKDKFALGNEELLNLKNTAVQILPSS